MLIALLCHFTPKVHSQCNPDVTPPTAICPPSIFLSLPTNGIAEVGQLVLDGGSYDECCLGIFEFKRIVDGPCDDDEDPDEYSPFATFCCADIGTPVLISMRVNDCSGNSDECVISVTVEDKINPVCPSDFVFVTCEDFDPSLVDYNPTDNCCIDTVVTTSINTTFFDAVCKEGVIFRTLTVQDCSGNTNTCNQVIEVSYMQHYYVKFPDDLIITDSTSSFGEPTFYGENCERMSVTYSDVVFSNPTANELRIERTWNIINWCTFNPALPLVEVPNPAPNAVPDHPDNLPGPVVSETGAPSAWEPTIEKINPSDPSPTNFSTFWNANANGYEFTQVIWNRFFVGVEGVVFSDTTVNCAHDTGESLLEGWTVKVTGLVTGDVVEVLSDSDGHYFASLSGSDTAATVTLMAPSNFGQNCQTEYTVQTSVGETVTQNVPVYLEEGCDLLSIGAATPRLRRCFSNRYTVQACNLSNTTIPNAYAEVSLDDYFEYTNSSITGTLVGGNTYSFQLGDLAPGECQSFTIDFILSCDAELGATHCTEARVYPQDDCSFNAVWSGADIVVEAFCDGDSVRFSITNVGSGDMTQLLEFVVVEDVVMRQEGTFQLGMGQTRHISHPATGSTWRLETQEEPFHPWGGVQAKALEGCGGLNNPGLVNLFPLSTPDPFVALDCVENIGAYDPNDKQGIPLGVGSQRFIKANTDIEYLIRFQNTGTDTAFTVVILDTLSHNLDVASVRVQVASHPMNFALLEGGILRFTFDNILLPDSTVNFDASNGFVKFRVAQKPDHVDGTTIENSAAIYFDFNEPVITNTTLHTIGQNFISVSTDNPTNNGLLRTYPNPGYETVMFELKEWVEAGRFELYNNTGQLTASAHFAGDQFKFERRNLTAGVYHFQITSNSRLVATGKIILH